MKLLKTYQLLSLTLVLPTLLFAQQLDTSAVFAKVLHAFEIQDQYPDSAYQLAQEVEQISLKHHYSEGLAYAYMRMGYLENIWGKNTLAKQHLVSVIQLREELKNYKGAADACINLSYIYQELGHPDSAFAVMYDALRLQEFTQDQKLLAQIHTQLAYLGDVNQHEELEIIRHFEQAQEISLVINDTMALIEVYHQWGNYLLSQKKFDEALALLLKIEEFHYLAEQSIKQMGINNSLANAYLGLKASHVAQGYYLKNVSISKTLQLPNDEGIAYLNLGVLHYKNNQADSSIFYYQKALTLFELLSDKVTLSKVYEALAASYALKKEYDQALKYQTLFTTIQTEIMTEERVNSIAEMQVKYDTEQKELALQLSQEEEKAQKAQKNLFFAGSMVLSLLLIIGALVYVQKQRVNEKNRLLQEQKLKGVLDNQELKTYEAMMQGQEEERLRISADLHDRLGSMLSTVKLLFSGLEDKLDKQHETNQQQYDKAKFIIDDACTEIRRISHNLGAGMVANFGLSNAIHELCDSINQSNSLTSIFTAHNVPENMPLKAETELYRIVQEAFNNAIKHAQASELNVQLNGHETELNLIIEDNGVGFDADDPQLVNGLGLRSIQNRVSLLGGTYHLDTIKDRGTTFIIDIPIHWNHDEDLHSG